MSLKDMLIKEKKLYYVYTKDGKYAHIRCLNRLSGKLQYDISLKTKGAKQIQELKICNNRVYVLTDTSVILFSLKGKKQMTYKLPGGINHVHTYLEGTFYSNADDISVSGKYIYYVNENGVFRCNTNQKKGFKNYYDTQNDPFFSQCRIFDLCAGKNGNFNIMFIEKTNIDLNMPTKLVEYIR